jgi:hypothetical protein
VSQPLPNALVDSLGRSCKDCQHPGCATAGCNVKGCSEHTSEGGSR